MNKLLTIAHGSGWMCDKDVCCLATGKVVQIISYYLAGSHGGTQQVHEILPHLASRLIDKDNETEEGFMGELNQPNQFIGDVLFSQEAIGKWGWDILNDREMIYWLKKGYTVDAAIQLDTSDFKRSITHDFIKRNISRLDYMVADISNKVLTVAAIVSETQEALTTHPNSQLSAYLTDCSQKLDQAIHRIERVQVLL